ncbi:MAG: hypothetical protein V1764_05165 [Nitrospirota bacterium]
MTVIELIERLQEYRQDARIVVQGYEDGFDDISIIDEITIRPAPDPQWYYGRYEKTDLKASQQSEQAVLLFGRGRSE